MLKINKRNANLGIGFGILTQIIASIFLKSNSYLQLGLLILGYILFIWGCMEYAKGKGYSKFLGLVGIATLLGLLILAILPDKNKGHI